MAIVARVTAEIAALLGRRLPPTNLKHRPIWMLPYNPFDGRYRGGSDCDYLSVGMAQYRSDNDPTPLSVKAWRYGEGKWNRFSEEVPVHRAVDMVKLLTLAVRGVSRQETMLHVPSGTFEGQRAALDLKTVEMAPETLEDWQAADKRLKELRDLLCDTYGLPEKKPKVNDRVSGGTQALAVLESKPSEMTMSRWLRRPENQPPLEASDEFLEGFDEQIKTFEEA